MIGIPRRNLGQDVYSRLDRKNLPYFEDENALHLKNFDESRSSSDANKRRYQLCYQQLLLQFLDFSLINIPFKQREQIIETVAAIKDGIFN